MENHLIDTKDTSFHIAIQPLTTRTITSRCHGRVNDRLVITAGKKAFPLASVEVAITDKQGIALARCTALPKNLSKNEWVMRMPVALEEKAIQFIVTAKDKAGNQSVSPWPMADAA